MCAMDSRVFGLSRLCATTFPVSLAREKLRRDLALNQDYDETHDTGLPLLISFACWWGLCSKTALVHVARLRLRLHQCGYDDRDERPRHCKHQASMHVDELLLGRHPLRLNARCKMQ